MSGSKILGEWRQLAATLIANLLTMPLGVIFSWIIAKFPVLLILRILHGNNFIPTDDSIQIVSNEVAFLRRLPFVSILAVLPLSLYISERFGRKIALAVSTIPFVLFVAMIAAAKDYFWILVAMNFGAIACAMQCYLVPIYVCEISDWKRTGSHGVIRTLFMGIGFCVGFYYADIWSESMDAMITLMLTVVFLIGLNILPESPVWLARVDRSLEAKRSSAWLRLDNESFFESETVGLIGKTRNIHDADHRSMGFIEKFKSPEVRRGFVITTVLLIGQAIVQINCIGAYFLTTLGLQIWIADRSQVIFINITIHAIICLITSLTIDRIGRKMLLIISCTGMLIAIELLSGLWIIFSGVSDEYSSLFHTIVALLAMAYSTSYILGMGAVPSVIAVEATSNNVVPHVYAISMAAFWISTWIMGELWEAIDWSAGAMSWCFGQAVTCLFLLTFTCFVISKPQETMLSPSKNIFYTSNVKLFSTSEKTEKGNVLAGNM